jgi:hypothetical protein
VIEMLTTDGLTDRATPVNVGRAATLAPAGDACTAGRTARAQRKKVFSTVLGSTDFTSRLPDETRMPVHDAV